MTRETKIGLLVGLAFIIVIGILLSEHLTTTTERPAAPLADAGHGVREAVTTPGINSQDRPVAPRAAEPQQPVPTANEIPNGFAAQPQPQPQQQPSTQVFIGPGFVQPGATQGQAPTLIVQTDNAQPSNPTSVTPPTLVPNPLIVQTPTLPQQTVRDPFENTPLAKAASQHGEHLVPLDGAKPVQPQPDNLAAQATKAREYKAQPGDTLSRIASLLPGGSTKANRDAIVKMNPTLAKDPNKIISGRTYLLPTEKATAPTQPEMLVKAENLPKPEAKQSEIKQPEAKQPEAKPEPKTEEKTAVRTYVVKAGDTLTKIAVNELGAKSEIVTIRKLNAEVLKGTDVIKVDMKLKLPAKQVAAKS